MKSFSTIGFSINYISFALLYSDTGDGISRRVDQADAPADNLYRRLENRRVRIIGVLL